MDDLNCSFIHHLDSFGWIFHHFGWILPHFGEHTSLVQSQTEGEPTAQPPPTNHVSAGELCGKPRHVICLSVFINVYIYESTSTVYPHIPIL